MLLNHYNTLGHKRRQSFIQHISCSDPQNDKDQHRLLHIIYELCLLLGYLLKICINFALLQHLDLLNCNRCLMSVKEKISHKKIRSVMFSSITTNKTQGGLQIYMKDILTNNITFLANEIITYKIISCFGFLICNTSLTLTPRSVSELEEEKKKKRRCRLSSIF